MLLHRDGDEHLRVIGWLAEDSTLDFGRGSACQPYSTRYTLPGMRSLMIDQHDHGRINEAGKAV